MKNAEKNPRLKGDLILCYMQSRHDLEEPQQLGSEKFSAFNLNLISTSQFCSISAIPLWTCEKAKASEYREPYTCN